MYSTGFPQIPPPATSDHYIPVNNGRPTHQMTQPPSMSQTRTLPTQIPPPGLEMMHGTGQPVLANVVRVPYTPHQPPPNFPTPIHRYGEHVPVSEPLTFVPQPHLSQPPPQASVQPPVHSMPPPIAANSMSTPAKTVFTPDYSVNDTSFTGIGTSFETPNQRTPIKPASEYAATNTSFTGIGLNFDTPASSPSKFRSEYYCDVCNFDLGGEESYSKHCQGLMHKQKVSEKEGKRPPPSTAGPSKAISAGSEEPKPKVIQDLREKYPDQYCEVCDTTMTSATVFKQHLQGIRHKKNVINRANGAPVLRGRGNRRLPKTQAEAEQNLRCQKLLDDSEDPLIGLQYMVEYSKNNPGIEERYVCELCDGKCDPRTLLPHIVGTKHRCNYVKKYHESLIEPHLEAMKTMRKAEKTLLMADLAFKVYEIEDGHRQMKAKVEIDPFYNPNQEAKRSKATTSGSTSSEDSAAGQKRGQSADSGPPAKRPPKSKATPNWGGPDPNKHLKRADTYSDDRFSDETSTAHSDNMGQYQADEEDGYHRGIEDGHRSPDRRYFDSRDDYHDDRDHFHSHDDGYHRHEQGERLGREDSYRRNVDAHSGRGKENVSPGSSKGCTGTGPSKNLPQNLSDIMQNLSKCLVNNEEEASMALQVSNTLTQALLQYRLKNLASSSDNNKPPP